MGLRYFLTFPAAFLPARSLLRGQNVSFLSFFFGVTILSHFSCGISARAELHAQSERIVFAHFSWGYDTFSLFLRCFCPRRASCGVRTYRFCPFFACLRYVFTFSAAFQPVRSTLRGVESLSCLHESGAGGDVDPLHGRQAYRISASRLSFIFLFIITQTTRNYYFFFTITSCFLRICRYIPHGLRGCGRNAGKSAETCGRWFEKSWTGLARPECRAAEKTCSPRTHLAPGGKHIQAEYADPEGIYRMGCGGAGGMPENAAGAA